MNQRTGLEDVDYRDLKNRPKEGDLLFFDTGDRVNGADHVGILVYKNGVPSLLHSSSVAKKVVVVPLVPYLNSKSQKLLRVRRVK
jgi:hypothetical protein